MPRKIRDVLQALENVAPKRFAFDFDKVGLQVGDENAPLLRAAVSLDRSLGAIDFAIENGCELLLAHHPLIFGPLDSVTERSHTSRSVLKLAHKGVAFIAAHTNWDSSRGGVNDVLAKMFELKNVRDFGLGAKVASQKLVVFCPVAEAEKIIQAASEAGAGVIGAYRRCAFQSLGVGSFVPDPTASPTIGNPGELTQVQEYQIEMVVPGGSERAVERAILKAHSYETPAYDFYPLTERVEQPAGRVGELGAPTSFGEFLGQIDKVLQTRSYGWGDPGEKIRKVAVVGGAADGEWMAAQRAGADVLITGEVKQHIAVEASESGLCIVAAGHHATENPGAAELRSRMKDAVPEVEWLFYAPEQGMHGRPFHAK